MVPIVTQLAVDFDGRALVGQVNVLEEGALTRSYDVSRTPTFVYFKDGREVARQIGATTYADLADELQALLATP